MYNMHVRAVYANCWLLGIIVGAFIVRLLIVPAVMALLGKHAWWLPKWLDRILPRVSIEGERR